MFFCHPHGIIDLGIQEMNINQSPNPSILGSHRSDIPAPPLAELFYNLILYISDYQKYTTKDYQGIIRLILILCERQKVGS